MKSDRQIPLPGFEPPEWLRKRKPTIDERVASVAPGRTPTSHDAAEIAEPRAGSKAWEVYQAIKASDHGLTYTEIEDITGYPSGTVTSRINRLAASGLIMTRGRRMTRNGAEAAVWFPCFKEGRDQWKGRA